MLAKIAAGERPDEEALPATVPAWLTKLITDCWETKQEKRPSASVVCKAFEEAQVPLHVDIALAHSLLSCVKFMIYVSVSSFFYANPYEY
jgi:hypothetical protein